MRSMLHQDPSLALRCDTLDFLVKTGGGYYFFLEFKDRRIYFSNNIHTLCDVVRDGETSGTLEDCLRVLYPWDVPDLRTQYRALADGRQKEMSAEFRLITRTGDVVRVSCQGHVQSDGQNRRWMIGSLTEISSVSKAGQFSGSQNMDYLKEETDLMLRREEDGFLLLVGVDDLKSINLKKGRKFGDTVLHNVAQSLEAATAGERRIYRVNGDCFAINLPGADRDQAAAVFQHAQQRLEAQCTPSGGCVPFREYMVPDGATLYQYAENTLDRAKAQGKNRLLFFSADDYEKNLAALELAEDLKKSIQEGFQGFSLAYQPQIRSGSYTLYGAEALLRYTSPRRGIVSPVEFVPILEQTELICSVGIWVLDAALAQCRQWRTAFPDFHISVNVSYTQLCRDGVVQDVLDALDRSGLPGSALTLEITESMQLLDYPHINDLFLQWKAQGIEISVNDFGTGYSSLGRLKELEVDEIKIDRCFVNNIQCSAYNYRLLGNMLELADSCQIRVCCEGVESEEELTALEELHPALLQGFLFSPPCTPQELESLYLDPSSSAFQNRLDRESAYHGQSHSLTVTAADWSENELTQAILNAENDIFYISDPETYELYYLNPAGLRLMGQRDYRGRKCYKVLQGRDEPCPFCTNSLLKKDDFYIWERTNDFCGRHFLLRDKLIPYHGRLVRMEVALDITKHEIVSQTTQERLHFAEKIAGYTRTLSHYDDYGEAVNQVLASVGEFYRADRAYLFEASPVKEGHFSNTFEWCAENIRPEAANLQDLPPDLLDRWMRLFAKDRTVMIFNLDALRKSSPDEWRVLSSQGITRLIAVPVRDSGKTIGFIGVDNPRYSIRDDSQIRVLSSFLVNRIRQDRNESRYRELLRSNYHDIFDTLGLGLWIIRMDPSRSHCEMLANDTMHRVLGITGVPSAEECYQFWYSRINDGYYYYVNQSLESMIQTSRPVQLEYTWLHPQRGEVLVRCTGIRVADEDGMICLEGYHRIINDLDRPRFAPDICARDIFEYHEKAHTIFFHTGRALLSGDAVRETDFPQCWIEDETVHPHFVMEFRGVFSQLRSKEAPVQLELLMKSKNGTYEWFKLISQHLSKEPRDQDSAIVVLEPVSSDRMMELEYMRMRKFYQVLLSESIAYAEMDLESGQLRSVGGLWKIYAPDPHRSALHFLEVLEQQLQRILPKRDLDLLHSYRDPAVWNAMLDRGQSSTRFCYQRPVQGVLHWVELTIYFFREDITRSAYALIYLKDINAEKEREFASEEAARRALPVCVCNRETLTREITRCAEEGETEVCGMLLLIALNGSGEDNQSSPEELQKMEQLLATVFRQEDLISRWEDDRFLVFLRGALQKEVLEERLRRLLTLLQAEPQPLSCNIGITAVSRGVFRFDQSLQEAEQALQESSARGKNRFSCYGKPRR